MHTQQFWICTSHAKTPLEVNCTSDDLVTLRAVATQVSSSFHSHHQHSWLRSLAVCSGAAGRCDAFIISAIIFLQHLHTEFIYTKISLSGLSQSCYILCSRDVVQCSRGTIWFRGANETLFVRPDTESRHPRDEERRVYTELRMWGLDNWINVTRPANIALSSGGVMQWQCYIQFNGIISPSYVT